MEGRCLYFVFCISLDVEEDGEKTHETTGIGVIEVVPLFYTGPRALYIYLYILYISLFMMDLFILLQKSCYIQHHQPRGFL